MRALSREETKRIHLSMLRIMTRIGVNVQDPETRVLLNDNGCRKATNGHILFTEDLIQNALSSAPGSVKLYHQNGRVSVDTADETPCLTPGSNCMTILDHTTGSHRPCLLEDISNTARLCDQLSNVNLVASLGWPSDVRQEEACMKTVQAMEKQSAKPIAFTGYDEADVEKIWGYLSEIAGGWNALSARPTGVELIGPDSPLRIGRETCKRIRFAAKKALPIICYSGLIPGVTGPMTLAGAIAQSAAEAMSCLVIHQLENPGSPFITGSPILPMDLRTFGIAYGGPEYSLAGLACVDYYTDIDLPNWIGAGCSDSHWMDAQAVAEASTSMTTAMMSRSRFIHNLGFLSSGKTGSLEMLVLGSELAKMVCRVSNGIATNSDSMGFDAIERAVSSGNTFLADHHTVKHVRTETTTSLLFDRISLDSWLSGQRKTTIEKIHDKISSILGEYHSTNGKLL